MNWNTKNIIAQRKANLTDKRDKNTAELRNTNTEEQDYYSNTTKKTKYTHKVRIISWLAKIAAMLAVLVMASGEAWGQRRQGMVTIDGVERYFGFDAHRPWHTNDLPPAGVNASTGSGGLLISPGEFVQIQCATPTSGAIYELQGFAIGAPVANANSATWNGAGTLLNGMTAANANLWRLRVNHARTQTTLPTGVANNAANTTWQTSDGALWLIVNWGQGVMARYEMTLNNRWQLVPRYGIFFQYEIEQEPPCTYTFVYSQLQGMRCNGSVTGAGWNRTCSANSAITLYIGDLTSYNRIGATGTRMPTNVSIPNQQRDGDVRIQVDNNANNVVTEYTICAGDVTGRNFQDMTLFKCAGQRTVQFEYIFYNASGNPNPGNMTIASAATGGTPHATVAAGVAWRNGGTNSTGQNTRRQWNGTAGSRSSTPSSFVRLPANARNGDYVEVRMYTWNSCNGTAPGTNPTDDDRQRASVRSAFIRVVAPTEVIDPKVREFCFQTASITNNNYPTAMTVNNNLTSSQADTWRYYMTANASGVPTGTATTGTASFNPTQTPPVANRLVGNGDANQRSQDYWVTYVRNITTPAGTTLACESAPAKLEFRVREDISVAPEITGTNQVCTGTSYTFSAPTTTFSHPVTYVWVNGPGYVIESTSGGDGRTGQTAQIRFTGAAGSQPQVRLFRMWTNPVSIPPSPATACNTTLPAAADRPGIGVTCDNCFSATATFDVTINSPPTATLSGAATICSDVTNHQLNVSGLSGGTSYSVTVSGGASPVTATLAAAGGPVLVTPPTGTTNYYISNITATGNSCPNTTAQPFVNVTKRAALSLAGASIATTPTPLCEGGNLNAELNGVVVGSETQLVWTYNSVEIPRPPGLNNVTYTNAGTADASRPISVYWRYSTSTITNGTEYCATAPISTNLNISAAPSVSIVPASQIQSICQGGGADIALEFSGGVDGNNYSVTWEVHYGALRTGGETTTIASGAASPVINIPADVLDWGADYVYEFSITAFSRAGSCPLPTAPTATATVIVERRPTADFQEPLEVETCENIPHRATVRLNGEPGRPYLVEYTVTNSAGSQNFTFTAPAAAAGTTDFSFTIPAALVTLGEVTVQITRVSQVGGRNCFNNATPTPLKLKVEQIDRADANVGAPYAVCETSYDGSEKFIILQGNMPNPTEYDGEWTLLGSTIPLSPEAGDETQARITSFTPGIYYAVWRIWRGTRTCFSTDTARVVFSETTTTAEVFYIEDEVCFDMPYELWAVAPNAGETGEWELWEMEMPNGTGSDFFGKTWWTVSSVAPPGLSLNADTRVISGRPRAVGTYKFTVTGVDAADNPVSGATREYTIEIVPAGVTIPGVPPGAPPNGQVGAIYSFTLPELATGVDKWLITSILPAGLQLNNETGVISGTPTREGDFTFEITEHNIAGNHISAYTITIEPSGTATYPDGVLGVNYNYQIPPSTMSSGKAALPSDWGVFANQNDFRTGLNVTLKDIGKYRFRWTVTGGGGCGSVSDFTTVNFLPRPMVEPIQAFDMCAGEEIEKITRFYTIYETNGSRADDTGFRYRWQFLGTVMDGFTAGWHEGQFPTGRLAPLTSGTILEPFSIGVEVNNGKCWSERMSIDIGLKPKPRDIQLSRSELCAGDEVTLGLAANMWSETVYNWIILSDDYDFIVPPEPPNDAKYEPFIPGAGSPAVPGEYRADVEAPPFSFRFETKNDNDLPLDAQIAVTATVNECISDVSYLELKINPRPQLTLPTHVGDMYTIEHCPYASGARTEISAVATTITSSVADTRYTWSWNGVSGMGFTMPATVEDEEYSVANTLGAFTLADNISTGRMGGTMTVTGETYGCVSEPARFQIWIKPRPDIRPPVFEPVCPVTLAGGGFGGVFPEFTFRAGNLPEDQVDYSWTMTPPAGTAVPGTVASPPVAARTYADNTSQEMHEYVWTVQATGKLDALGQGHASGCVSILEPPLVMNVLSRPVINIVNPNDEVCSGNDGDRFETITFNTGDDIQSTYNWTVSQPPTVTDGIVTTGATTLWGLSSSITFSWLPLNTASVTGGGASSYIATVTVNATSIDGCVADQKTTTLTINQTPVMTTPDAIEICSGDIQSAIPLSTANGAPTSIYSWKILDPSLVKLWGGVADGSATLSGASAISTFTAADNATDPPTRLSTEIEVWATHTNGCLSEPVTFPVTVRPEIKLISNVEPITVCPDDWVVIPAFYTNVYGYDVSMIEWKYIPSVAGTDVSEDKYFTGTDEGSGNIVNFYATKNPAPATTSITGTFEVTVKSHWSETNQTCASDIEEIVVRVQPTPEEPVFVPDTDNAALPLFYCHSNSAKFIEFNLPTNATLTWESYIPDLTGGVTFGVGTGDDGKHVGFTPTNNTQQLLIERGTGITVWSNAGVEGSICRSEPLLVPITIRPVARMIETFPPVIEDCSSSPFTIPKFELHDWFMTQGYINDPDDPGYPGTITPEYLWSIAPVFDEDEGEDEDDNWYTDGDVLIYGAPPIGAPTNNLTALSGTPYTFSPVITGTLSRELELKVTPWFAGCEGVEMTVPIVINPTPNVLVTIADLYVDEDLVEITDAIEICSFNRFENINLTSDAGDAGQVNFTWRIDLKTEPSLALAEGSRYIGNTFSNSTASGAAHNRIDFRPAAQFFAANTLHPGGLEATAYISATVTATGCTSGAGLPLDLLVKQAPQVLTAAPGFADIEACSGEANIIRTLNVAPGFGNAVVPVRRYEWVADGEHVWDGTALWTEAAPGFMEVEGAVTQWLTAQNFRFDAAQNTGASDMTATLNFRAQHAGTRCWSAITATPMEITVRPVPVMTSTHSNLTVCPGETVGGGATNPITTNRFNPFTAGPTADAYVYWTFTGHDIFTETTITPGTTNSENYTGGGGNLIGFFTAKAHGGAVETGVFNLFPRIPKRGSADFCEAPATGNPTFSISLNPTPELTIPTLDAVCHNTRVPAATGDFVFSSNQDNTTFRWQSAGSGNVGWTAGSDGVEQSVEAETSNGRQFSIEGFNAINGTVQTTGTRLVSGVASITVVAHAGNVKPCPSEPKTLTITVKPVPQTAPIALAQTQICTGGTFAGITFGMAPGFTPYEDEIEEAKYYWYLRAIDDHLEYTPNAAPMTFPPMLTVDITHANLQTNASDLNVPSFRADIDAAYTDGHTQTMSIRAHPYHDGCLGDFRDVTYTVVQRPGFIAGYAPENIQGFTTPNTITVCSGETFGGANGIELRTISGAKIEWDITQRWDGANQGYIGRGRTYEEPNTPMGEYDDISGGGGDDDDNITIKFLPTLNTFTGAQANVRQNYYFTENMTVSVVSPVLEACSTATVVALRVGQAPVLSALAAPVIEACAGEQFNFNTTPANNLAIPLTTNNPAASTPVNINGIRWTRVGDEVWNNLANGVVQEVTAPLATTAYVRDFTAVNPDNETDWAADIAFEVRHEHTGCWSNEERKLSLSVRPEPAITATSHVGNIPPEYYCPSTTLGVLDGSTTAIWFETSDYDDEQVYWRLNNSSVFATVNLADGTTENDGDGMTGAGNINRFVTSANTSGVDNIGQFTARARISRTLNNLDPAKHRVYCESLTPTTFSIAIRPTPNKPEFMAYDGVVPPNLATPVPLTADYCPSTTVAVPSHAFKTSLTSGSPAVTTWYHTGNSSATTFIWDIVDNPVSPFQESADVGIDTSSGHFVPQFFPQNTTNTTISAWVEVIAEMHGCPSEPYIFDIRVKPTPKMALTFADPIVACSGDAITIPAFALSTTAPPPPDYAAPTFNWYITGTDGWAANTTGMPNLTYTAASPSPNNEPVGTNNVFTPSINTNQGEGFFNEQRAMTLWVRPTHANCTGAFEAKTITINPRPRIDVATFEQIICAGDRFGNGQITFSSDVTTGTNSFTWSITGLTGEGDTGRGDATAENLTGTISDASVGGITFAQAVNTAQARYAGTLNISASSTQTVTGSAACTTTVTRPLTVLQEPVVDAFPFGATTIEACANEPFSLPLALSNTLGTTGVSLTRYNWTTTNGAIWTSDGVIPAPPATTLPASPTLNFTTADNTAIPLANISATVSVTATATHALEGTQTKPCTSTQPQTFALTLRPRPEISITTGDIADLCPLESRTNPVTFAVAQSVDNATFHWWLDNPALFSAITPEGDVIGGVRSGSGNITEFTATTNTTAVSLTGKFTAEARIPRTLHSSFTEAAYPRYCASTNAVERTVAVKPTPNQPTIFAFEYASPPTTPPSLAELLAKTFCPGETVPQFNFQTAIGTTTYNATTPNTNFYWNVTTASHPIGLPALLETGGLPDFLGTSGDFEDYNEGNLPEFTATSAEVTARTATVQFYAQVNGCYSPMKEQIINVHPYPQMEIPPVIDHCGGLSTLIGSAEFTLIDGFMGTPTPSFNWEITDKYGVVDLFTSEPTATDVLLPQSGTGDRLPPFRPAHTAADIEEIVLRVTPFLNGCTGKSENTFINIWRQPVIAFNTAISPTEICSGASFGQLVFNSSNVTTASLQWSIPAPPTSDEGVITTGISSLTGTYGTITFGNALFTAPISDNGNSNAYTETLTLSATYVPVAAKPTLVCRGDREDLKLTVLQAPVINNIANIEACAGETITALTLGVSNSALVEKYSWSIDKPENWDMTVSEHATTMPAFIALNTSTAGDDQTAIITVTATHEDNGLCTSSRTFNLQVRPEPLITSTHNGLEIAPVCPAETIVIPNFTNNTGDGIVGLTTAWTLTHNTYGVLNDDFEATDDGTGNIGNKTAGINASGYNIVGTFSAVAQMPKYINSAILCKSLTPAVFTAAVKPTPDAPAIIGLTLAGNPEAFEFCNGETSTTYNFFTGFVGNTIRPDLDTGDAGVAFEWALAAGSADTGYDDDGLGNLDGVTVTHPTTNKMTRSISRFNVRASVDGCNSAWSNDLVAVTVKPVAQLPESFALTVNGNADYACSNTSFLFNNFALHTGFTDLKDGIEAEYRWNINQVGTWLGAAGGLYELDAATPPAGVTWNETGQSTGATNPLPPFTVTTPQLGDLQTRQLTVNVTPWYDGCAGVLAERTITIAPTPTITGFNHLITCSDVAFDILNLSSNVTGVSFAWNITTDDAPTTQRRITGAANLSGTTTGVINLAALDPGTRANYPLNITNDETEYKANMAVTVHHNTYPRCSLAITRALTVLQAPVLTRPLYNLELCSGETFTGYPLSVTNQAPLSAFRWDGFDTNVWNPAQSQLPANLTTPFTMSFSVETNTTNPAIDRTSTGNIYAVATHTVDNPNSATPATLTFPCSSSPEHLTVLLRPVPIILEMESFNVPFCPGEDVEVDNFETTPATALVKWEVDRRDISLIPFPDNANDDVYDTHIGTFAAGNPNSNAALTGKFTGVARLLKTTYFMPETADVPTGLAYCAGVSTDLFSVTVDPAPETPSFVNTVYNTAANRVFCDGDEIDAIVFQTVPTDANITWHRTDGVNFGALANGNGLSNMGGKEIPDFVARNFTTEQFTQGVSTVSVSAMVGRCESVTPLVFDLRVQPVARVGGFGPVNACSYLEASGNYTPTPFVFSTAFLQANPGLTTDAANFNWAITNYNAAHFALAPGASANGAYLPTFRPNVTGGVPEIMTLVVTPVWTDGKICAGTPSEFSLNLHPLPQIADIPAQEICSDSRFANIIFGTSNSIEADYEWTVEPSETSGSLGILNNILTNTTDRIIFPDGVFASNITLPLLTADVAVTATSRTAGACVNSRTFNTLLSVFQRPIMVKPADVDLCSGALTTLPAFATSNVNNANIMRYEWRTDKAATLALGGANGAVVNGAAGSTFPALPPFTPQNSANSAGELVTVWVSATHATALTDERLCVSDEAAFTIMVRRAPEVNQLIAAVEYCPETDVGSADHPLPVFTTTMDATHSPVFHWTSTDGHLISTTFEATTSGSGTTFPPFTTRVNNTTTANPNGTAIVGRFDIWAQIDYGDGVVCGEGAKRELTIALNPRPGTPEVNMAPPEFCHTDPVSNDAAPIVFQSHTTDPLTWAWTSENDNEHNNIGQITSGNSARITRFNATNNTDLQRDAGRASFYAIATSAKGCPSYTSDAFVITVKPVPQLADVFPDVIEYCASDPMPFTQFTLEQTILDNFSHTTSPTFQWRIDDRNYIPEANFPHNANNWMHNDLWASRNPEIDTIMVKSNVARFPNNVYRPDGSAQHPFWGVTQRIMTLLVEPNYAGCVGTVASIPVIINPLPITNIIPSDPDDCVYEHGNKIYYADDGRITPGIVDWIWDIDHDAGMFDSPEVLRQGDFMTILYFPDNDKMEEYSGTMHLKVINEFTCSSETSLKINAIPVPRIRAAQPDMPLVLEICTDVDVQLDAVLLNENSYSDMSKMTFTWFGYNMPAYLEDGVTPNDPESLSPWINGNRDGNIMLRAEYETDKGACRSANSILIINANRSPDAPIVPNVVACEAFDEANPTMKLTVFNHDDDAKMYYFWERVEESAPGNGFDVAYQVAEGENLTSVDMLDHLPTNPLSWADGQLQMSVYYRVGREEEYLTRSNTLLTCPSKQRTSELRISRTPAMPDEGQFVYCEDRAWPMYTLTTAANDNSTAGFYWEHPDGTFLSPGDIVIVNQPGNSIANNNGEPFMYRVRAISTFNCRSNIAYVPLTIHQNPVLDFDLLDISHGLPGTPIVSPMENACAPLPVIGKINSDDQDILYLWEWQPGSSADVGALSETPHTFFLVGSNPEVFRTRLQGISTVNFDMRAEIGACRSDTILQLTISPSVRAGFVASAFEGCHPTTVGFQNTSQGAFDFRWYWNTPDGTEPPYPGHVNPALDSPVIEPNTQPGFEGTRGPNIFYEFTNETAEPKQYHLWLQVDNGGCFDNKDTIITIYPMPRAMFAMPNLTDGTSICPPLAVDFVNTSNDGQGNSLGNNERTRYRWSFGNGIVETVPDDRNMEHVYENMNSSMPIPHIVEMAAFNSHFIQAGRDTLFCMSAYARQILVNPQVEAQFDVFGDAEGCSPFPVQFMNSSRGSAPFSRWDFGDGSQFVTVRNPAHIFENESPSQPKNLTVTLLASNTWCSDEYSSIIQLLPRPLSSFEMKDDITEGCQPLATTFINTSLDKGNPENVVYFYDFDDLNTFNDTEKTVEVHHSYVNMAGAYLRRQPTMTAITEWTVNNGEKTILCSSIPAQQDITVYPYVKADFQYEIIGTNACSPVTIRFLNASQGFEEFSFDFGDNTTVSGGREEGVLIMHTFTTPTMYEDVLYDVGLTVRQGNCVETFSDTIRILSQPVAAFRPGSPYPSPYTFPAPPIQLENQINPTDRSQLTYQWTWNQRGDIPYINIFSTLPFPSPLGLSDWGEFEITQRVIAPNRVCFSTLTLPINIVPPGIIPNFDDVEPGCMPYSVRFNNTSRNAREFVWEFGEGGFVSSETNPRHTFLSPGTHRVTLTAIGDELNSISIVKYVTVLQTPQAGFAVRADELFVGQPLEVNNFSEITAEDGTPLDVWYRWDFGDGTPFKTDHEPTHIYMDPGAYTITLTVGTNTEPQCSTTLRLYNVVELEKADKISLPNVFRPDTTGEPSDEVPLEGNRNYLFFPPILSPTAKYHMTVYNRWGVMLYETHEVNRGWNGYYRGKLVEEDVYMYRIEGVFQNGTIFQQIGDIIVIR